MTLMGFWGFGVLGFWDNRSRKGLAISEYRGLRCSRMKTVVAKKRSTSSSRDGRGQAVIAFVFFGLACNTPQPAVMPSVSIDN